MRLEEILPKEISRVRRGTLFQSIGPNAEISKEILETTHVQPDDFDEADDAEPRPLFFCIFASWQAFPGFTL